MEFLIQAAAEVFTAKVLALITLGALAGIIVGAIPGFTITMGIALTLPFTFGMSPIEGLATMLGVYVGGYSGGQISGILLGIPGTPSSICTTFDGHPMAKKGQPGRALALGVISSFLGGLVGAVVLIITAVPIARFALRFGPWEIFSLIVFALTLIASLGSKSLTKGLMAGAFGLLLATFGIDPVAGQLRFTFGLHELTDGFEFLPVLIGLFALPQMIDAAARGRTETKQVDSSFIEGSIQVPWLAGLREVLSQWVNLVRSGLIGCMVGALPAAGGVTSNFLAYDQAQKMSKHPEKFGTGIPDGIIASEAGNNGTAGGSLIPTIALGIPGNAITAVMLGALILHGITPGPMLLRHEPVLVYGVFIALIVAHFSMLLLQIVGLRGFLRIAKAPSFSLVPAVLTLCVVGSFALNNRFFDVWVFLLFGLIGYLLSRLGVPLAPVVLGLILGPLAESNLRQALMINPNPNLFFTRPISALFLGISLLSIAYSAWQIMRQRKRTLAETG